METVDLQAAIDARDRRLRELDRFIRIGELRLESETLEPEERLRIQIRLEQQRAARADLLRANTRDRREAATSELTLLLHTREAPAGDERDEGGAAGTARDALHLLGAIGIVALFLAIVLTPVLLLAVLVWLALRSRSRRIETRLLDRPEPAGPGSK
jgi:Flp pilus assembly protein TadB